MTAAVTLAIIPMSFKTHRRSYLPLVLGNRKVVGYGISRLSRRTFVNYRTTCGSLFVGRCYVDVADGESVRRIYAWRLRRTADAERNLVRLELP